MAKATRQVGKLERLARVAENLERAHMRWKRTRRARRVVIVAQGADLLLEKLRARRGA
jgi:hypothetical protein